MARHSFQYDAFISHAVKDKIPFAFALSQKLKELGLKVWYSSEDLDYSGQLSQSIHDAMANSRFGVVIFSPTYLERKWTMEEFYHFWNRDGKTKPPVVVLPIYLDITAEEVSKTNILIADRFSVNADKGVDLVAEKIRAYITKETVRVRNVKRMNFAIALLLLAMVILSGFYWWKAETRGYPTDEVVESLISDRVSEINPLTTSSSQFISPIKVTPAYIDSVYTSFVSFKSYYRNEYEFRNGFEEIRARKNVNEVLGLLAQDLNPSNSYKMDSVEIFQLKKVGREISYRYINLAPVIKTIEPVTNDNDLFVFNVHYKNNIRTIEVSLLFPSARKDTKRHKMQITGLKPIETYQLYRSKGEWKLRELETTPSEGNR